MVKVQVDLNEEEDKIVDLFRAENRLKSKQKAIKEIIMTSKNFDQYNNHINNHMSSHDNHPEHIEIKHRKKDYIN